MMCNQVRASTARAIANYGLWETSRRNLDVDRYDAEDDNFAPATFNDEPRLAVWRSRAIRWSLAGGVFLAYVNHWPGGH